jgi:uroporphyrinogen-III synthase
MRELICTKAVAEDFLKAWESAGIQLKVFPLIKIRPLPFHVNIAESPDIWIFTSSNAVKSLKILLQKYFLSIIQSKKIVAIGHKTADSLGAMGFRVIVRANNALALAEEINEEFHPQEVLHFCGDRRRSELSESLTEKGFSVTEKKVYQNILTPQKITWGDADGMLFFSPSAVESYVKANEWPAGKIAYAIGPTTAAALQQRGIEPVFTAREPNSDSLLQAVLNIRLTNKE